MKAVAAMSLNRVIGVKGKIPWESPEDMKWFRSLTTGHTVVFGRLTYETIGKPLPGRNTIVLSRAFMGFPGVRTLSSLAELPEETADHDVFICGGAEIYKQAIPLCSDVFLTVVRRKIENGDAFMPEFEDSFPIMRLLRSTPELNLFHYRRLLDQ